MNTVKVEEAISNYLNSLPKITDLENQTNNWF